MTGGPKPKCLNKPCIMLIVIAGMERFAYKGVASNLVTYLTDIIQLSNSTAAKTVNSWCGFTSIMPLLVAPLADSLWDHYSTILVSSLFYILGLAALTSTTFEWAWPVNKSISTTFMFWSLCLISLGQGGYNPSLQAFGADQLGEEDDLPSNQTDCKKSSKRTLFFTWWYFGVCSGSLLGVSIMSYIQDTLGWSLGFAVPTLVMIASILLFSGGTRCYAFHFPDDQKVDDHTPFKNMAECLKAAVSRVFYCGIGESKHKVDVPELELQENQLSSQKLVGTKELGEKQGKSISLSDKLKISLRLLPIWTMLLLFAVIFQQPATFFTKQGMTMKRNIGAKFKIPPATLQGSITVSIILLMPLYDKILVPCTQVITRNEKGITVLQRMGAGMVLSIIAMVIAALVEEKRLKTPTLSIFWLLPQYILLGISDIFTVVGMQEFFYGEVPIKMRTMGIALYTSVFGVGSFLSAIMISLIELFTTRGGKQSWFSDDMSKARLDKYYWLLAILSTVSFLVYIVLCRFHKSRNELGDENDV